MNAEPCWPRLHHKAAYSLKADDRGMKHTRYILRSEPPKFLHRTKEPNQAPCIDYTAGMSNLWHLKKPLYYEKFQTYLKVDRIV